MDGIEFAKLIFYTAEQTPQYDGAKDSHDEALRLDDAINTIVALAEDFLTDNNVKDYVGWGPDKRE